MVSHILNVDFAFVGHEADDREDDEPSKDASGTVGAGHNQRVPGRKRPECGDLNLTRRKGWGRTNVCHVSVLHEHVGPPMGLSSAHICTSKERSKQSVLGPDVLLSI